MLKKHSLLVVLVLTLYANHIAAAVTESEAEQLGRRLMP